MVESIDARIFSPAGVLIEAGAIAITSTPLDRSSIRNASLIERNANFDAARGAMNGRVTYAPTEVILTILHVPSAGVEETPA